MIQLVQPNLSAVGRVGWCLEYQSRVWGTTHNEPYAWTAWQNTQLKHTDTPPTDVAYPLWFEFYEDGINKGHVVSHAPGQGYYSSPWQPGTTHAVLPSIAEVERIYGVKYVGWSEDILQEQVIKGDNMVVSQSVAEKIVTYFYRLGTGQYPTPGQAEYWVPRVRDVATGVDELGTALLAAQTPSDYVTYTGEQLFVRKKQ